MDKVELLDYVKEQLKEKLKPNGWKVKLRMFIDSNQFDTIIEQLHKESTEDGKRFTPPLKYVFRAFEECPLDDLKVVVIGQDPYPTFETADGLAFSCSLKPWIQPSLKAVFDAIDKTVYPEEKVKHDGDLKRWANQGVLLLNSALTCQIGKPGTHYKIWQDFINYVIDMLNHTNTGLIFVLMGKKAQEFESLISENHYVLKTSHPMSAIYSGTSWDCDDVFNKINQILKQNNGSEYKIKW